MLRVKFLIQTCAKEEIAKQKYLLEQEGIEFNSKGKVNLSQFQWQPKFDEKLRVGE